MGAGHVPWVDDGTRYFPDEVVRLEFLSRCRAELDARGLRYVLLSGSWDERYTQATTAIEARYPSLGAALGLEQA